MSSDRPRGSTSVTETSRRRRRPSGEPPPLPRPAWWPKLAIALAVTIVIGSVLGYLYAQDPPDPALLEALTGFRSQWIMNLSKALSWFASAAGIITLRLVLAVVLIVFRGWRHLAVTLGAFAIFDALVIPLVRTEIPAPNVDVILSPTNGVYYFPRSQIAGSCAKCTRTGSSARRRSTERS